MTKDRFEKFDLDVVKRGNAVFYADFILYAI